MMHLLRPLGLGALFGFLSVSAAAATTNPAGRQIWLQGYDLNPVRQAFRNEGTVKLECVDDALTIGLEVTGEGLHNAEGGLLLFREGAGGSRYFRGRLLNEGTVQVDYGAGFVGPATWVENDGEFRVSPHSRAHVLGPDAEFWQGLGTLDCGGGFEVWDGEFHYRGGAIEGEPQLVRSRLRLDSENGESFTAALLGDGAAFEGTLRPGQVLRVLGSAGHGMARAVFSQAEVTDVGGEVVLSSTNAALASILEAPHGLRVASSGRLLAELAGGGLREVRGPMELQGTLEVQGTLRLASDAGLTHGGRIAIGASGDLTVEGELRQTAGEQTLEGGRLRPMGGFRLEGGVLRGRGMIAGALRTSARVELEVGAEGLTVRDAFTQASNGSLVIRVSPETARSAARPALTVQGTADLQGALKVDWTGAEPPPVGTRLPLIEALDWTGELDHFVLPQQPADRHWELEIVKGTLVASVHEGAAEPNLQLVTCADGKVSLQAVHAAPLGFAVEYSTDLRHWLPLQQRLAFQDGAVCLAGLPADLQAGSVFFRVPPGHGSTQ